MDINGLFEIHITVDKNDDYYKLWSYTFNKKDFKLILAVSDIGVHKEQFMISKWKNGTVSEAIDKANKIAKDMIVHGIKVERVKVESMAHNPGVPDSDEDFNKIKENFVVGKPYFEFHAKIDIMSNTLEDSIYWCNERHKSYSSEIHLAISANICGSGSPLLTIRIYDHGRNYSIRVKNEILDNLKKDGYKVIGNIQQEFSIYDTNDNMDKGWLIL